ncbi:MAG TPA: response regulator [Spirochaetota bacterium]|nr:response regulator [Spirochaetota bacterium]
MWNLYLLRVFKNHFFLSFFMPLILLLSSSNCYSAQDPITLDLTIQDLSSRSFQIDSDWEFYPEKIIFSGQFDGKIYQRKKSKYVWPPNVKYGTYRIQLDLPEHDKKLAILFPHIFGAYRAYLNGKLITKVGEFSTKSENNKISFYTHTVPVDPGLKDAELIIHVANFSIRQTGFEKPLEIGTLSQLDQKKLQRTLIDLFIAGSLFYMGFYHLVLFFLRKKEKTTLFLGLFCFVMFIRTLIFGERLLYQVSQGSSIIPAFEIMNYLSFYLGIPLLVEFFYRLYPQEFKLIPVRVYQVIGLIAACTLFLQKTNVTFMVVQVYEILSLLIAFYGLFVIILALKRKREDALLFFIGLGIFSLAGLNEALYNNGNINTFNTLGPGLFLFLYIQSYILARRFSSSFVKNEMMKVELEKINLQLLSADKLKDEFLANTSHELRTPLIGIIGLTEALLDGVTGPLSRETRNELKLIYINGKRLAMQVNDILDFSRLKNNDIALRCKDTDLQKCAELVLSLSRFTLGKKKIEFKNSIKEEFAHVFVDESRIQQVLNNLIGNAIKFTDEGVVEVTTELVLEENGKPMIALSVSDTGIGIAEEKQQEIFNTFVQADGSIIRKYGGTGLGLSITKRLVELHGGNVSVCSKPGYGSCFTITLPVNKCDLPDDAVLDDDILDKKESYIPSDIDHYGYTYNLQSIQTANDSVNSTTIMVVDDEPVNIHLLRNSLILEGYNVITADNGFDALQILDEEAVPDLILLDIMLPKLSGYDVAKKIRERFNVSELPIIMLTAKSQVFDIVAGFDLGANDYVTKPFEKRELMARIKTLVSLKKSLKEREKLSLLENEMNLAQKVQGSIFASYKDWSKIEKYDIAIQYVPQNSKVSGDYYHITQDSDNSLYLLVADASGHGVQAALRTAQIDVINRELGIIKDPATKMNQMNSILIERLDHGNYLTAFALNIIDNQAYFSAAGHTHQIVVRAKNCELELIHTKGTLFGLSSNSVYTTKSVTIGEGDIIFLFTDGIFEQFGKSGKILGEEAFYKFVKKTCSSKKGEPIEKITSTLVKMVTDYVGDRELNDDITCIGVRIKKHDVSKS